MEDFEMCKNCKFAIWESETGAKDCGLPSGTMYWIDGCKKESTATIDEDTGECTEYREIDEFEYDYDY